MGFDVDTFEGQIVVTEADSRAQEKGIMTGNIFRIVFAILL